MPEDDTICRVSDHGDGDIALAKGYEEVAVRKTKVTAVRDALAGRLAPVAHVARSHPTWTGPRLPVTR